MCFVAYIPLDHGFLLGSNRDEHISRPAASMPKQVMLSGKRVLMPVDGKAGGTWIALREDGVAMVLLNGAFVNHKRKPAYRHSRGIIIPQLMHDENPGPAFETMNLQGIEPFTLLLIDGNPLLWRWDGNALHGDNPDPGKPLCLSSPTLYNEGQQAMRSQWYFDFLSGEKMMNADGLLQWLTTGSDGDAHTSIVLKRTDGMETISSTVVSVGPGDRHMLYSDNMGKRMAAIEW